MDLARSRLRTHGGEAVTPTAYVAHMDIAFTISVWILLAGLSVHGLRLTHRR